MKRPLLLLKGFRVAFGERIVLSGVDLQLPAKGVTLVMGPCGTGKSTLLHALCGNLLKVPAKSFSRRFPAPLSRFGLDWAIESAWLSSHLR